MLTPLEDRPELARAIGIDRLLVKREDLCPTGSFKFRSATRQIEHLVEMGIRESVVSSSGNAALSLAEVAKGEGVRLFTCVSPDIHPAKLHRLLLGGAHVIVSKRAMRFANYLSAHYHMPNLRPSMDDHAVIGFIPLGEELEEQTRELGGVDTVVSFCTSGASLLGMCRGFRNEPRPTFIAVMDAVVGAQGVERSRRLPDVGMVASIVTVMEVHREEAEQMLLKFKVDAAPEAIASFAWILANRPVGTTVWVLSGQSWKNSPVDSKDFSRVHHAETLKDIDDIYGSIKFS